MVKAVIKLKDGTEISIEGSPEQVARTRELLSSEKRSLRRKSSKIGPMGLILELKSEGFFDSPKSVTEIRDKLQENAHHYPLSSLSPALIRLVRNRELGRLKQGGKWTWVKR